MSSNRPDPDLGDTEWLDRWIGQAMALALESGAEPHEYEEVDQFYENLASVFVEHLDEADEAAMEADRSFRDGVARAIRANHSMVLWNARVAWLLSFWLNRETRRRRERFFSEELHPEAEAILRVHGRALLTCGEIFTLAEHGFGSGAVARWRTLHELEVVGYLLRNGGDELAVAYLEHEVVQSAPLAERILGELPPDADAGYRSNLAARAAAAAGIIERRGKSFARDYAWAEAVLLPGDRPSFASLERAAESADFRPVYRDASDFVHAGGFGTGLALTHEDDPLYVDPRDDRVGESVCGAVAALASLTDSLRWAAWSVLATTEAGVVVTAVHDYWDETLFEFERSAATTAIPRRHAPGPGSAFS